MNRFAGLAVVGLLMMSMAVRLPAEDSHPNFSGTWTLDREKSDMGEGRGGGGRRGGMFAAPMTVEQNDNSLVVKRKFDVQGQERSQELHYTLDGKSNVNEGFRGEVKSTTHWEGSALVTESKSETANGTRETKEVRPLSEDGQVMTVETTVKGGWFGEGSRKLVYRKQ